VIGDIGAGSRTEQLAFGETPNITARVQGPPPRMKCGSAVQRCASFTDCLTVKIEGRRTQGHFNPYDALPDRERECGAESL
jgi:hypothetical protein